jgi:uncharacterized protein
MWYQLGRFVLRNRILLLILLLGTTVFMGWKASKVKISYEFSNAIPTDNPKLQEYLEFRKNFGTDAQTVVVGVQSPQFFNKKNFDDYRQLLASIKKIKGVEGILAVPSAITLQKNDSTEKLVPLPVFPDSITTQAGLDTARVAFENLVFYHRLLYNPVTKAYLAALTLNSQIMLSPERSRVIADLNVAVATYKKSSGQTVYTSGLPLIRTQVADRVQKEMGYFLLGSLLLATITLILFFRSGSATILSLLVVIIGVIWCFGTLELFHFRINLLTALAPPLMIVIGIPNCIYFLNKYHSSWIESGDKKEALISMLGKMGVVTLFCNIAAAVGFGVFALTKSALLREFGIVAGINIMALFIISLILIPTVLSFLPPPGPKQVKYLNNSFLERVLNGIEYWVLHRKGLVYGLTAAMLIAAGLGIFRLKTVGYVVDDLPKNDKIYTDLKWFEKNFGGVLPLEIVIDSKRKNGVTSGMATIEKIDAFSTEILKYPAFARPLNLVEGLKFAKQAYYDNDSTQYVVPNEFDMAFLGPYLKTRATPGAPVADNAFNRLVRTFIDSTKQRARISVNMADVGTIELPRLIDTLQREAATIFDTASYKVQFTGGSVTFVEGSRFIIQGLKDSILYAFLLIAVCMLYLFRSLRILLCSLIPNLIPLVVTAGIMGWTGVPLKPSTVLVFSVALGIAIDVTIRFLVNYRQELPIHNGDVKETIISTIHHTGISIIYTSLVLIAGFIVFCFSSFGGTQALGWLTSFTLLIATFTNLVFLPVLMLGLMKKK